MLAVMLDLESKNYYFGSWEYLSLFAVFQLYSFLHYLQRKRPALYLAAIVLFDFFMIFPLNSFLSKVDLTRITSANS